MDLTLRYVEFTQLPYEVWQGGRLLAAFACKPHMDRWLDAIARLTPTPSDGSVM